MPSGTVAAKPVPTLRVVNESIDTMALFWRCPLAAGDVQRLRELKVEAQEARRAKVQPPTVRYGAQLFEVLPSAGRKGELVLDGEYMTVIVEPDPLPNMQTVSADLKSFCLHQPGGAIAAAAAAQEVVKELAVDQATDEQLRAHVTRIDLCRDFQGWMPRPADLTPRRAKWYDDRNPQLHARSRKFKLIGDQSRFESAVYGKKSSGISAEIYNKSLEIEVNDKGWFKEVWKDSGRYDPDEDVIRVEFRIRREGLTEMHEEGAIANFSTWEEVWGNLEAIWRYLTSSWLVMRGHRTAKSRQVITPFWLQLVEGAQFHAGTKAVLREKLDRVAVRCLRALAGYIVLQHTCIQWFDRNQRLKLEETAPRILEEALLYIDKAWGGWQQKTAKKIARWQSLEHLYLMGEDLEEAA